MSKRLAVHRGARPATSNNHVEVGAWIWLDHAGDGSPHQDPYYDEHLEVVFAHPAFERDVRGLQQTAGLMEALRKRPNSDTPLELARQNAIDLIANKWGVTRQDLQAVLLAENGDVELSVKGDKVFVEVRPTEYVVHVPRPITKEQRDTVKRWLIEEKGWLSRAEERAERSSRRKAHPSPKAIGRDLELLRRWFAGETTSEIYETVNVDVDLANFANRLDRALDRLKAVSPEGLGEVRPTTVSRTFAPELD